MVLDRVDPVGETVEIVVTGDLPPGDRDPVRFSEALRGMVLAWRDAWRELRGGPPVATMLNLSPVFPIDDSVPAAAHACSYSCTTSRRASVTRMASNRRILRNPRSIGRARAAIPRG